MKRVFLLFVSIVLYLLAANPGQATGEELGLLWTCGNANGDGSLDISDGVYLTAYIFSGGSDPIPLAAGNADGGCRINLADVVYIYNYIFNGGPAPFGCPLPSGCTYGTLAGNSINMGCKPYSGNSDSIAIPIYISNSVSIKGVSVGFHYPSDNIEITSVDFSGSIMPGSWNKRALFKPAQNQILVGGFDLFGSTIVSQTGGLLCKLNVRILSGGPDQFIDLDSSFVGPGGDFMFVYPYSNIRPEYVKCKADFDSDGIPDDLDNCPTVANPLQTDTDADSKGDVCDNCPNIANSSQADGDGDGISDTCDNLTSKFAVSSKYVYQHQNLSFVDSSLSLQPIATWNWRFGDDSSTTDQNPSHLCKTTGVFDVGPIVSNGGAADTLTKPGFITVFDSPSVYFDISQLFNGDSSDMVLEVRAVDLDYDNNVDLVFSVYSAQSGLSFGIAWGHGNGTFDQPVAYLPGMRYSAFAFGFANADTLLDIVAVNDTQLKIMINQGNRAFVTRTFSHSGDAELQSVATGYFNNDSYMDIVATSGTVYFGDGQGGIISSYILPVTCGSVDVADFNADGSDDLILTRSGAAGGAQLYLSDGAGHFSLSWSIPLTTAVYSITTANAVADFDRDGNVDFASILCQAPLLPSWVLLGFGDGNGGMRKIDSIEVQGVTFNVVAADVNRDGNLDLAVSEGAFGMR